MNGINGAALWSQASTPEGRVYYYNTQTKATQWTKPSELMTPAEVGEPHPRFQSMSLFNIASSCESTMEGIRLKWKKILVLARPQPTYGKRSKLMTI